MLCTLVNVQNITIHHRHRLMLQAIGHGMLPCTKHFLCLSSDTLKSISEHKCSVPLRAPLQDKYQYSTPCIATHTGQRVQLCIGTYLAIPSFLAC